MVRTWRAIWLSVTFMMVSATLGAAPSDADMAPGRRVLVRARRIKGARIVPGMKVEVVLRVQLPGGGPGALVLLKDIPVLQVQDSHPVSQDVALELTPDQQKQMMGGRILELDLPDAIPARQPPAPASAGQNPSAGGSQTESQPVVPATMPADAGPDNDLPMWPGGRPDWGHNMASRIVAIVMSKILPVLSIVLALVGLLSGLHRCGAQVAYWQGQKRRRARLTRAVPWC